jgi:hypothetical protein
LDTLSDLIRCRYIAIEGYHRMATAGTKVAYDAHGPQRHTADPKIRKNVKKVKNMGCHVL